MRVLILVFCLLALRAEALKGYKVVTKTLIVPSPGYEDDEALIDPSGRIINGERAVNGQFPWATRLSIRTPTRNSACSGSIISDRFILSAYHCVDDPDVTSIQFRFNSIDLNSPTIRSVFAEAFWYVEPTGMQAPDLAMFRTDAEILFGAYTLPIRLPSSQNRDVTFAGAEAQIMGFGVGDNGSLSNFLQFGNFLIRHNIECNYVDHRLCATPHPNLETSTQGGDSGGGWVVQVGNAPILIGVHRGRRQNSTTNIHIATRTSSFLDFISRYSGLEF